MSYITEVSDDSFKECVINSNIPVLVDFWAEWCGPCKAITPILEEIAKDYKDRVLIAKMDVDQNPDTPPRFGVRGIPTLILFNEGKVKATKVGLLSRKELDAFLTENT